MPRREWVEGLVMIAVIVAWWPVVFAPFFPFCLAIAENPVYRIFVYLGTPIPLLVILALRIARYRKALAEADDIAEQRSRVDTDRKLR